MRAGRWVVGQLGVLYEIISDYLFKWLKTGIYGSEYWDINEGCCNKLHMLETILKRITSQRVCGTQILAYNTIFKPTSVYSMTINEMAVK